jgi:hypothetical protein
LKKCAVILDILSALLRKISVDEKKRLKLSAESEPDPSVPTFISPFEKFFE